MSFSRTTQTRIIILHASHMSCTSVRTPCVLCCLLFKLSGIRGLNDVVIRFSQAVDKPFLNLHSFIFLTDLNKRGGSLLVERKISRCVQTTLFKSHPALSVRPTFRHSVRNTFFLPLTLLNCLFHRCPCLIAFSIAASAYLPITWLPLSNCLFYCCSFLISFCSAAPA